MSVLNEIGAGFDFYAMLLELPDYQRPMSFEQHVEILKARQILN